MIFPRIVYPWMRLTAALTALLLTGIAGSGSAQQRSPGGPGEPAFMAQLFPPDLIMRHATEIGLTEDQRKSISQAVSETQAEVFDLQWTMQDASAALTEQLRRETVDEAAALASAQRVMETEVRIKRAHLRMLIRIRNSLQPEQRGRLEALRSAALPGAGG